MAIRSLSKDDSNLQEKLANIFGIEYDQRNSAVDIKVVDLISQRLIKLRQFTSDEDILSKVERVACNQEDLETILRETSCDEIYLCDNSFSIPLDKKNKTYIGIGKAEAVIDSNDIIDFESLNLKFKNVHFDTRYRKLLEESPEYFYRCGIESEQKKDYKSAFDFFQKSMDFGQWH